MNLGIKYNEDGRVVCTMCEALLDETANAMVEELEEDDVMVCGDCLKEVMYGTKLH